MRLALPLICLPLALLLGGAGAQAQTPPATPAPRAELSIGQWLLRMHEASRRSNYVGTFVVSSGGVMSSSRIWHACDGRQQIERVEALTGSPRLTFRHNDRILTFLPEVKRARTERSESHELFPGLLVSSDASLAEFYAARRIGADRVAGFDADVVDLAPKDRLRWGYRVWSERKSGLVVRLQTLDADGRVLEQAAFSELQLDAPVSVESLSRGLDGLQRDYQFERGEPAKTSASAEGWRLREPVAGFRPIGCYKRDDKRDGGKGVGPSSVAADGSMQWIFSDGLASVSLFLENHDRQRHLNEAVIHQGATATLTRRIGDWWLTAVGEVPPDTLKVFAQNLERRK